jgi:hypothetical protein
MKQILKWAVVVFLGGLVGAGLAIVVVSGVRGESPSTLAKALLTGAAAYPYPSLWGYRDGAAYGLTGEDTSVPALQARGDGFRPGMMVGYGGRGMVGPSMHRFMGRPWTTPKPGERLSAEQAAEETDKYLLAFGDPDLELAELMEFSNHFYVEVEESGTGMHAFELLVDPYTGAVYPEPGPNMMWNTKYGHMGSWWGRPAEVMEISPDRAREIARGWLDVYMSGAVVDGEADAFYGYYTIHVLRGGGGVGMLSVHGYTGQVWYHNWHGDFIQMSEPEG